MSETKYVIYTIIYTLIAAVFVIKLGPDLIRGSNEIDGTTIKFQKVNKMTLKLLKEFENQSYIIGGKSYDSLPFKIAFDTTNRKYKHLLANIKLDTLELKFTFNVKSKNEKLTTFLNVLDEAGILKKNNFEEQLPKTFTGEELDNIKTVEIVLEKSNDYLNSKNSVKINDIRIQGYNIKFRKIVATIIAYGVMVLSSISLLLIPYGAFKQLRTLNKSGVKPYVPNRWDWF